MKNYYWVIILLAFIGSRHTQLNAQPAPVKAAAKAVFTLTTFNADGTILASSHGVFIGSNGEAISDLTPFLGAAKAVVVDANGKKMDVERMMGVNSMYDLAKFRVSGKTTAAQPAPSAAAAGSQAWLLPYAYSKNDSKASTAPIETRVKGVETFMEKYPFYIFDTQIPENVSACPFVNAQGQVLGLLQLTQSGDNLHAPSAKFIDDQQVNAISINDATFSRIGIPPALPTKLEDAQLALMVSGNDAAKHAALTEDFIQQYPNLPDGYQARAQIEMAANKFDDAARDMSVVIKNSEKKDEAYFNYGQLIYNKLIYNPQQPYAAWTYDTAMEQADKAYSINPLPVYKHLQAQINFSKGNYQKAHDMFMELTNSNLRSPEVFYEAAHAQQMLNPKDTAFIALIDSAIVNCDSINHTNPAPYILARAQAWETAGYYRKAVNDYGIYGLIMRPQLTSNFYYVREQCEVKAKLFQQALIDINTAIALDQQNVLYYAEKANLLLRVNQLDAAITVAEQCIGLEPEYSDGYLVLGLAQIQNKRKPEGLRNLERARDLGNPQAQPLIDKYK